MPGQSPKATTRKSKKYALGVASKKHELELPSGNVCLVTRPGVQGLIKAGLLDSLDTLTSIVQIDHIDANDPKRMAQAAQSLSQNAEKLLESMKVIDKVVCHVVVEPQVFMPPEGNEQRDPDRLYADEVDLDDKAFIFQYIVGGTRDLVKFRAELSKLVDGVPAGEDVPV